MKAPDGTVYLTTSSQDPGGQTYVAIVQPDGGVKFGAPLSGTALSGVVVGPGGKLYQTTDQGTYVLDTSSWTVRHAPEDDGNSYSVDPIGADGIVTGSIHATDLDNDTLTYEFDGGEPGVEVQQDGSWTFTPTDEQRAAASDGTGPSEVTFTVIATDGKYRTPISVVAPIDPAGPTSLVLPAGAKPATSIFVDEDGTAYQASYVEGANTSYLTVIDGGSAVTSGPMPGKAFGEPKVGKGGITYLTTIESGSEHVYVNAIGPDGEVITTTLRGRGGGLVLGTDGTVAATSYVSLNGRYTYEDGPFETYVTVFDATGHPHDADPIVGVPRNNVVIGPDGTLYQATAESLASSGTSIVVIAPDGTRRSGDSLGGEDVVGDGVVVGAVGPAYLTTSGENSTFVTIIDSDGTMRRVGASGLPGRPTGSAIVDADGTAYVSTWDTNNTDELDDDRAHLYAISPAGTATELADIEGIGFEAPVLGGAGEVYQTYATYDADADAFTTYTLVIDSGGTQHLSDPMAGLPGGGVQLGQDGVAYQLIRPGLDADETSVYTVTANGLTEKVGPFPGDLSGLGRYVAADGTTYLVSVSHVDINNQTRYTTHMTIIGADGQVKTASVPRAADVGREGQSLVVGQDGTLYQVTVDGGALQNYATTMNPDGTVHSGTPLSGDYPAYQSLVKAPDGTIFMTSSNQGPGGVGGETYVAIVQSDGGIRIGDPIAGRALAGVVVSADGTIYQTTTEGTYMLDTSSWVVRHAPEDDGDA